MVVLDTHAWIWLIKDPSHLGRSAASAIEQAERIVISAISCYEVAWLQRRGRISLDRDIGAWVARATVEAGARQTDVTPEIALRAAELDHERFPGDPADRVVYATAVHHRAELITRDAAITAFDPDRVVWD